MDEMREAFGKEEIDSAIRSGMVSGGFYAQENGYALGIKTDCSGCISSADMVIGVGNGDPKRFAR